LKELGLRGYVELIEGDALEVFPRLGVGHVDFAYIDGPDDADFTVQIFERVLEVSDERTVFAFDDFCLSDPRQVKGEKLYPALVEWGIDVAFRDRIAVFQVDERAKELFHGRV
jgi:predicted O-methyltransferase YrrM